MTVDERGDEGSAGVEPQAEDLNPATEAPTESSNQASVEAPPPPPPPGADAVAGLAQTEKSPEERKALLANTLQGQVAGGARIESQGDFQAVVVSGHRVNHLLHFFVGLFTLGFWWIVGFFIAIFGGEKRRMINVDQFGNVFVQKV
jgi:hypothetical protein